MLGEQHVRSGVVGGLCLLALGSNALGAARLTDLLILPAVAGGAALLPDIDTRSSTVTRAMPVVTVPIHYGVSMLHRMIYAATRSRDDPPGRPAHRGITHSIVASLLMIPVVAIVFGVLPGWVTVLLVFGLVALAGSIVFAPALAIVYAIAGLHEFRNVLIFIEYMHSLSWLWAIAVGIGLAIHCLGDCSTTSGAPLLAPFSWDDIRPPFTFRTGGWFELNVVRIILIVAVLYLQFVLHVGFVSQILSAMFGEAVNR